MSRDLRVGLVGYGLAGAVFHAPLVAATPGLRLTAIVTSNDERRAAAARAYPAVRLDADTDALLTRASDLDLVVIASPNRTHVPLALAAVSAGLPVVVDKPLAVTSADARQLIDAARRRGTLLTVFQNRRWDGDFLTVRRVIAEQRLGEVFRFESRFDRWRPDVKPGWRMHGSPEEGGGLLYDLGSHLIDQARLLFGPVTHVYAELDRRRAGVEVDDDAFVALTHASGVRSQLWMSALAAQLAPRFRVLGTKAAFTKFGLDGQEEALRGGGDPGAAPWGEEAPERWGRAGAGDDLHAVPTEPGAYPAFYRALVDALRGGGAPPVDPEDAVATLQIIEAAQRSALESRAVTPIG